jgi:hypothetical protein
MSKTAILTGPDGRYYEIPLDELARYAVPPEKVGSIRKELGAKAEATPAGNAGADPGAIPPGHLPPGHTPPGPTTPGMQSMSIQPNGHGGVVLNFYFGGPPGNGAPAVDAGVEGYHLTPDETACTGRTPTCSTATTSRQAGQPGPRGLVPRPKYINP